MWRSILIADERGLGRVLKCLIPESNFGIQGEGGVEREEVGSLVRSIRFGGGRWMTSFDFEKVLSLCGRVEEVWIDGLGIRTSWLMAAPCEFFDPLCLLTAPLEGGENLLT